MESHPASYEIEALPDGSGLVTITAARSSSPLLKKCAVITDPVGYVPLTFGGDIAFGFTISTHLIDVTEVGSDYELTAKACNRGRSRKA